MLPFVANAVRAVPKQKVPLIILTGFLGTFFPAYLFCIAETRIDSAVVGILNALTPLFTILIGVLIFKNTVTGQKWLGVITGLTGLVLLLFAGRGPLNSAGSSFGFFVLLATIFYAINVNLVNRYLKSLSIKDITAISLCSLLIPSLIILWFTNYFRSGMLSEAKLNATTASIILGLFGTAIGTLLFYTLIKRAGLVFSSMVTYGIPFVALSWGLLDGEQINFLQLVCLCVILAGVYLTNK